MPRIFDCFPFFNELDLLEIRLNELSPVVDRFVIAEATVTHRGRPKPLYFHENRDRFAGFRDRIRHVWRWLAAAGQMGRPVRCQVHRDAGWHFTYMGGVEAVAQKLEAFAHVPHELASRHLIADREP